MAQFSTLYTDWLDRELGTDKTDLFTLVRRKAAVNEGIKEFARLTECFTRQATIALVDSTAEYDLEAITAADYQYLAKDGVLIKQTDSGGDITYITASDLTRTSIARLDAEESGWREADPGTPSQWYIREDGGKVYLGFYVPPDVPAGDTWQALVTYVASPPDLTNEADIPFTAAADVKTSLTP